MYSVLFFSYIKIILKDLGVFLFVLSIIKMM